MARSASRTPARPHSRARSPGPQNRHPLWLRQHRDAAGDALRHLLANPLGTLLTMLVMAIAISLPATLHLGLAQFSALAGGWQTEARLSLFLNDAMSAEEGADLALQLEENPQILRAHYLSRDDALAEFSRYSGMAELVATLPQNPLPATILVEPTEQDSDPGALAQLAGQLGAIEGVDEVVVDMAWVERLRALMALGERLVWLLTLLLGGGALLIIGNSIRLEIERRQDEIQITRLVGATDRFIRRPFLYTGAVYGMGAGLLALAIVALIWWYLGDALGTLLDLYPGRPASAGLDFKAMLAVPAGSVLVGMAGAWLAVLRHLRDNRPG